MKVTTVATFSQFDYANQALKKLKEENISQDHIHFMNRDIPDRNIVDPFLKTTQLMKEYHIPDIKNEYYNIMLKNGHYVIAVESNSEITPHIESLFQNADCESIESYISIPKGYESSTSSILM